MPEKVLLIDNYDSFVYNIYQSVSRLGFDVHVFRNDRITHEEIKRLGFTKIVISPGPGSPENTSDFGVCGEVILRLGFRIPVLGVCLGHQGIISAFGGKIVRAPKPMHGKMSTITHNSKGLFSGVKNNLRVMRYHSLACLESALPECLDVTARSLDDNLIMGVQHKTSPIFGVQFHPESIMTEEGDKILMNFLRVGI